jgi:DNA-directed RNA polymerase subunit RPC12/RpoP
MNKPDADYSCHVCGRDMVADLDSKQGMYICPAATCKHRAIIFDNGTGGVLRWDLPAVNAFPTVDGGPATPGKPSDGGPHSDPSDGPLERSVSTGLVQTLERMAGVSVAKAILGGGLEALAKADAAEVVRKLIGEKKDGET